MTRMVQTPFCLFVFVFLIAYGQSFSIQQISSATNIQETSNELVGLLLSPKEKRDKQKIQDLVDELVEAKVTVDLNECLDGSLYFSNVIEGPTPLWERFGFFSGNIQGQQYTFNDKEMSVINYAELLGNAFHLRAYGTYEKDKTSLEEEASSKKQLSLLDRFSSFAGLASSVFTDGEKFQSPQPNLVQCPADFVVSVSRASIHFGSKSILDIPIAGTGYLRILYADPKLRIFVSPKSTTDDRWEKAGLKVAQVCVDLLDPEFERLL